MALNRDEILSLDLNGDLVEDYLVESMQNKHQATVATKRLAAALDANDELHAELAALRAAGSTAEVVTGDVLQDAAG